MLSAVTDLPRTAPKPVAKPAEAESDRALLQRVARGDKAAMRRLYLRHHDALQAFVCQRCDDPGLAEDVVQETMLAVWLQAGRFAGQSTVRTWIFSIARHKLVDRIRRSARLSFTDELPDVTDAGPGPAMQLQAAQIAERVRDCVARLNETHVTVVRLALLEGLAYEDIARIERIPLGTVKSRVHNARKALAQSLGPVAREICG